MYLRRIRRIEKEKALPGYARPGVSLNASGSVDFAEGGPGTMVTPNRMSNGELIPSATLRLSSVYL